MQKNEVLSKELKRNQFNVLAHLEAKKDEGRMSQRAIAEAVKLSVGTVNSVILELEKLGYVDGGVITDAGLIALEPYRVKRAIILAAGFGERLIPITLNTPKPLVRIGGTRIIDTILDSITALGIDDIIIVRGYLSEQFDQLLYKYPSIKFVENPNYAESNNISSMMCVRYMLQNAYVLDSDLFINNTGIFTKYQYATNYLGIPTDVTDDWVYQSKGGFITGTRQGGTNTHIAIGFSYWTSEDGARMAEHVREVYETPGGKERFWDQVALVYYNKEYKIEIRECNLEDITEIDTFSDLKKLDKAYSVGSTTG